MDLILDSDINILYSFSILDQLTYNVQKNCRIDIGGADWVISTNFH